MTAPTLLTLLNRWAEAQTHGRPLTAAQLCAEAPHLTNELEEAIAILQRFNRATAGNSSDLPPHPHPTMGVPIPNATVDILSNKDAAKAQQAQGSLAAETAVALPGYEILGELGRGGFGVVYKARQMGLNRLCAIKVVRSGAHTGAADLARFRTEAEAVARLQHPNIVQVFEVGDHGGHPYLCLEFCPGGSLDQQLDGTPWLPKKAVTLAETLSRAMHTAHQAQVIHRDLKPANILLASDGTPKITDFGLAKKLDDVGHTQSGAIMGTPSYMAPEQAEGKKTVSPATDVYALGAILYELLTGRPPFKSATPLETILAVISDDPVPPRSLNRGLPVDLETICLKCLRKEPGKRYSSALELADDLTHYQRDEPIQARPVGASERGYRWVRRNPVVSTLAAATVLVLVLGVIVSSLFALAASREAIAAQNAREEAQGNLVLAKDETKRAETEKTRAETQLNRSELLVYANTIEKAQRAWQENKADLAHQYLAECQWNLRGWEHRHLWTLFNSNQATFKGHTRPVTSVAWSPDGKRILSGSYDNTVKVWDAQQSTEILSLKGHTDVVTSVAWSTDGKRILSGSHDSTVKVWDAKKGAEILSLKGHTDWITSVAWSADGKAILSGSDDKTVKVWDAEKGQEVLSLKGHTMAVESVAWSPDSKAILSGSGDNTVKVWDAQKGQEVLSLKGHVNPVTSVAWSPDGKAILSGSGDNTVKVWDAQNGQEIFSLKGHTSFVNSVAWSPDSSAILSGSWDKTVKVWDAQKGREVRSFKGHTASVSSVAWSPDGKGILSGSWDNTAKVWDARKSQEILSLKGHTEAVTSVAWSPYGKTILSGSRDKTVKVWDAQKGTEILSLKGHTGHVTSVAWSPDGKGIVSGSTDNKLKLWDAEKGREVLSLKGHTRYVTSVAWSPDGKRILSGSGSFGKAGEVKVWNAENGQEVLSCKGHASEIRSVAWSPDGKRILSGSWDSTLKVWDAQKGEEVLSLKGHARPVLGVAWSPDGKAILSGSDDKTVKVWDAEKGQEVLSLIGHQMAVTSVAWSPDGKAILSGSGDDTLKVWDARSGQELLSLKGHKMAVTSVAWKPDGKAILSGGGDDTLKVWDAQEDQEVLSLMGYRGIVANVAYSLDGKTILAQNDLGKILAWDADKGHLLANAPARMPAAPLQTTSPDGRSRVRIEDISIVVERLSDRRDQHPDRAFLELLARPDPEFHRQKATLFEKSAPFAAAFHLRRLLLLDPKDEATRKRLVAAEARHVAQTKQRPKSSDKPPEMPYAP